MKKLLIVLMLVPTFTFAQRLVKQCYDEKTMEEVEEAASDFCVSKKLVRKQEGDSKKDSVWVMDDTVKAYYTKNGKLKYRRFYRMGTLQGKFSEYYESGQLRQEGMLVEGKYSGEIINYYKDGSIKSKVKSGGFFEHPMPYHETDDFEIIEYRDSLGQYLVKDGEGNCNCNFSSSFRLSGKVIKGTKEGVWQLFKGDTLSVEETYSNGKFVEGVRFVDSKKIKFSEKFTQPEFPGGFNALVNFIKKNLRYPSSARRKGESGTVYVQFIVDKQGNITEPTVIKGVSDALDAEAARVVSMMPRWRVGMERGKEVFVRFVLPIRFKVG